MGKLTLSGLWKSYTPASANQSDKVTFWFIIGIILPHRETKLELIVIFGSIEFCRVAGLDQIPQQRSEPSVRAGSDVTPLTPLWRGSFNLPRQKVNLVTY